MTGNPQIAAIINAPDQQRHWKSTLDISFTWLVIVGCAIAAESSGYLAVSLLAIVIIASRQHALLALAHEGAHRHLSHNRTVNDIVSDIFCAMPLFLATHHYRHFHFKHHRHVNSEQDPDWISKKSAHWNFPKRSKADLVLFILKTAFVDASINRVLRFMAMLNPIGQKKSYYARFITTYLAYALLIDALIGWKLFVVYWMVPAVLILPIVASIRSVAEHFGLGYGHELEQSRDILASWFERQLFGPYALNYHLTHHLFPEAPRYRLPKIHAELIASSEFKSKAKQNDSYFGRTAASLAKDLIQSG